jgi:SAM-dependent methyltransferase
MKRLFSAIKRGKGSIGNTEYCVRWIQKQAGSHHVRVLDYGCGAGKVVKALQERNIDASGCDVFYEGGDYSAHIDPSVKPGSIRRMESDAIPFDEGTFDYVITDQVMEHVENLDVVLAEIARVLKPGGRILSMFPDKGVWREGHCGIPLLHKFPKNSEARIYYAALLRVIGFGHHTENKTAMQWSRDFCSWLDDWTHYRSLDDIESTYLKHLSDIDHIEEEWLHARLGARQTFVSWMPVSFQRFVVSKLGGLIFIARKPLVN